jgi:hypothetical protein
MNFNPYTGFPVEEIAAKDGMSGGVKFEISGRCNGESDG